jgi:hypothetical protein
MHEQELQEQKEPTRCVWRRSTVVPSHVLELWNTDCGHAVEGLKKICPHCTKRVLLVGFDAWWEARKSYHP